VAAAAAQVLSKTVQRAARFYPCKKMNDFYMYWNGAGILSFLLLSINCVVSIKFEVTYYRYFTLTPRGSRKLRSSWLSRSE